MNRRALFVVAAAAGVLAIVGTFGVWATGHIPLHPKGFDANAGKSVLSGSLIAVLLLGVATLRGVRWAAIVAAIPAGIAGAIAGWYFASPSKFVDNSLASRGWGIYLAAIGSIVLFATCLLHAALPEQETAA